MAHGRAKNISPAHPWCVVELGAHHDLWRGDGTGGDGTGGDDGTADDSRFLFLNVNTIPIITPITTIMLTSTYR